jgi:glucokinase
MSYYLGIDVGGTNVRVAVATEDATILGRASAATPTSGSAAVTDEIIRLVELACDNGGVALERVRAVGVGSAGPFDEDSGAIATSPNLSDSAPIQIVKPLENLLAPDSIVLRNDAICGAIAERHFADDAVENAVYLTISTGIGAGVIVDDDLLFGTGGNAAEVGHMTVDPAGRMTCGCGRPGHWEAYCGGANIPDYAASVANEASIESDLPLGEAGFTAEDVFDALGDDQLADLVVDRIGHWNAIGVANTIQAFAPTRITVGGAVALNNPSAILDPIRRRVPDRVMIDVPVIELTDLGEDIVLKGAILSAQ